MKYTVEWLPTTLNTLADLWNNAPDRADVAAAADALDAVLERNPLHVGESRGGSTRLVFLPPLAALFDVHVPIRRVMVWRIWRHGPPTP
jgi:hypothetical protein